MIRIDAIPAPKAKSKRFVPFTSAISAAAIFGIYLDMTVILLDRI